MDIKVGDSLVNTGGIINLGKRAVVVALGPFEDAPECDLLVQSEECEVMQGTDNLWKEHKFYTMSENWALDIMEAP